MAHWGNVLVQSTPRDPGEVNMYYDFSRAMGYNKLFNLIVGPRGCGKTYGAKKLCYNRFLSGKGKFVYIRRYGDELRILGDFFSQIGIKDTISTPRGVWMQKDVDGEHRSPGEQIGYFLPINRGAKYKSVDYSDVSLIIFDEFVVDRAQSRYLTNEPFLLMDLYETIARDRDVKIFLIGNRITDYNPYFDYFGLEIPYKKSVTTKGDFYVEYVDAADFKEHRKNTRFGRIAMATGYGGYSIENIAYLDTDNFIAKKTGTCRLVYALSVRGRKIGVWDNNSGISYLSDDCQDPPFVISHEYEDHSEGTISRRAHGADGLVRSLLRKYDCGMVRFETVGVRDVFKVFYTRRL